MKDKKALLQAIRTIDGRGYGGYKNLKGLYDFDTFQLALDHIQVDPFAPPSRARLIRDRKSIGIPEEWLDSAEKRMAVGDFLTRHFEAVLKKKIDKKANIRIDRCGQEILERTSVLIFPDRIEICFEVELPAAGRRILGKRAAQLFEQIIPELAEYTLSSNQFDLTALESQIHLVLDQMFIRQKLDELDLVSFVANGAILPRKSGISDLPLSTDAVPFQSPPSFEIVLELPYHGVLRGMGIPKGISLIVGGGYHGKTTLLEAIERGVYHHIAGDGREFVITKEDAVKVRAEDGRSVKKVNISPFIKNLPGGKDTIYFSTENASGSTSQGTIVVEALEAESSVLLIDEDTTATNFMIRDGRMQKLISADKEPITPYIDKVEALYHEHGISTILIAGGSGDYFDVANCVIMMDEYIPKDVTVQAKEIAASTGYIRESLNESPFGPLQPRVPLPSTFSYTPNRQEKIKARGVESVTIGKETIDLSYLDQLVSSSQTNAIAMMLGYLRAHFPKNGLTLSQIADWLYDLIDEKGLQSLSPYQGHPGNLARPRKQEFCAALNRYRHLKIR